MKVAISTTGQTPEAPLDPRFGRARNFLVYDLDQDTFQVIDNTENVNAAQGAGLQTAAALARAGVNSLVTGHCGPKAFEVLVAAGITVYTSEAATVAAALEQLRSGALVAAQAPDRESHWA
jgi:predicted Fe-Mo cluster-binding NifX family protein